MTTPLYNGIAGGANCALWGRFAEGGSGGSKFSKNARRRCFRAFSSDFRGRRRVARRQGTKETEATQGTTPWRRFRLFSSFSSLRTFNQVTTKGTTTMKKLFAFITAVVAASAILPALANGVESVPHEISIPILL